MKIRNPKLLKALAVVGAWVVKSWMCTVRLRHRPLGPDCDPRSGGLPERYIYAIWHEDLLLPSYQFAQPDMCVLISHHADGQLITDVVTRLGFQVVRGSPSKGFVEAARGMLNAGKTCHLVMTPDGPRGPRRDLKAGVVYFAAQLGMSIVPAGFGYSRVRRMNSWDQFAVPRPFSTVYMVSGAPIQVPVDADRDQLEAYRKRVEDGLLAVSAAAHRWAETGVAPMGTPKPVEVQQRRLSA